MGTDIHLYIERQNPDGTWTRARPQAWTCPWCRGQDKPSTPKPLKDECFWCKGEGKTTKEYHERNYDLFAILANVRNGTGFAGCDTGDGFQILAEPRGLPKDTSIRDSGDDVEYEDSRYISLGDHSFTHCTLAEALEYDYTRVTQHRGVVDAAEYSAWVEAGRKGAPKGWCGGVGGIGVKHVSQFQMDKLIERGVIKTIDKKGPFDSPKGEDGFCYYTTVQWEATYRESVGEVWFEFLEACRGIGHPDKVRFVIGFDS